MAEDTNGTVLSGADGPAAMPTVSEQEQLGSRMGIRMTEYAPDRVVGVMPVSGNRQPYGLLHGGANAVLAEQLGSIAAALHAGADRIAVGLELSCTHHRAATEGNVTGVATPLHRGGSTATYEIVITDEQDRRTCSARLTCLIREKPPSE
ncbi:uncharacterized protein (TIGR00369 family) [Actinopolyspora biskrensis]|uniref:Uncharacterized protein (TIGR00369 family) n=2 Tax=Actinopolyspora biskrensis TaxID=1470178 RepID=A0A852Z3K8_9ACTN|nr:uncharacterized protein (TIGR00369 family) [Actinopolyspora biskrensis]